MDYNYSEHTALITDFIQWQIKNPKKIISQSETLTKDGRLVFNLSINDTQFRLLCPANYPNHEDCFFIETECTGFWCIAINEFIIDSPKKLSLDVILTKTFLYYTPSSKKSYENSENESENENENYCDLNDCTMGDSDFIKTNDEWEFMISRKKREWRKKEGELRMRYNRPKISDMFDGKIMDHPQQVFSNTAASEILINDLINIMSSKDSCGIIVDPIENDICKWSVLFKDFQPHSKISKDLRKMKELYGYDYIQLQLDFTMDLYPSHPPILKFIRPQLMDVFDMKNFVKLANWNPARDMMSVLKEIKGYIDLYGRIDIPGNKCNDINVQIIQEILLELSEALKMETKSETSSSTERNMEIEMILTRFLYYLKRPECKESCLKKFVESDNPEMYSYFTFNLAMNNNVFDEINYDKRISKTSSYYSSTFKAINKLMENEKLETQRSNANYENVQHMSCNKKNCNITTNPVFGLEFQTQDSTSSENEKYNFINKISIQQTNRVLSYGNKNNENNSSSSEQRKRSDLEYLNDSVVSSFNANIEFLKGLSVPSSNNSTFESNENFSSVFKILKESVLITFIQSKLVVDTFFIIWRSTSLYSKIIEIIIELASNSYFIDLLTTSDIPNGSIIDLLKIHEENVTLIITKLRDLANGQPLKQADLDRAELARSIIDTSNIIELQLIKYCSRKCSGNTFPITNNQNPDSSLHDHQIENLDSVYKNSLHNFKFYNYDIDVETHTFKNDYIADINSSQNYFPIAQEFAVLSKYLPLELSSSIFVQMDNSKPSLMRAVITGAEGTCCSGGCFTFDIYLRENYPYNGLEISCTTLHEMILDLNDEITVSPVGVDIPKSDAKSSTKISNTLQGALSNGHQCLRNSLDEEIKRSLHGKWNVENASNLLWTPISTKISNILQVLTFIQNQKLISYFDMYAENLKSRILEKSKEKEILLANIIQFAMINQIRKPTPGFEDMILTHFRLKKDQILKELEQYNFLKNSELLNSLKKEFDRLTSSKKT